MLFLCLLLMVVLFPLLLLDCYFQKHLGFAWKAANKLDASCWSTTGQSKTLNDKGIHHENKCHQVLLELRMLWGLQD